MASNKKMLEIPFEVRPGGTFLLDPVGSHRIFTPEDLTDEQKSMRDTALRFADEEVLPRLKEIESQTPGVIPELLRRAGELGFLMLDIPEKYDGLEQDKVTTMLIAETLSRCGSFAVSFGAHVGIGTLPLVYYGTVEQKERYLPKLGTGELLAAYALTETGSGSDALAAKTTATLSEDGEHYVLNGSKQFITNAGFAGLFTVFAKIDGRDFSAFLVERDTPGLTVGPEEHKHGIKGSSTCPLTFEDVRIPVGNLLGERGKGHRIAFNILNVGRARLGIGSTGAAKYALDLAVRYGNDRKQFGRAITEFGMIRAKIGEIACRIYASDSLCFRTAGLIDRKYHALEALSPGPDDDDFQVAVEEYTIEASIMKVVGSELLDFAADEALQIHGGYGYIAGYPIERVSRDARINRLFEGTNEINRLLMVQALLKRAMRQRLPLLDVVQQVTAALDAGKEPDFEPRSTWLVEEQRQVERMKAAALYSTAQAVQKFMMALEEQQGILAAIADMLIDTYASDSCVARALQCGEGCAHSDFFGECTTLFVEEARGRVIQNARAVLCATLEGEERKAALSRILILDHWRPIDRLGLRDGIALRMLEEETWTFH